MAKEIYGNEKPVDEGKISGRGEAGETISLNDEPEKITGSVREAIRRPGIFAKTLTSLYVDDASIKLLEVKGAQVVNWAELPLEPGMVNDGIIADPFIMAEKIKKFLQENKIKSRKMIVGFSGLHCLSRILILPPISKTLLNEAVKHEAERELPVPMENVYLSWQIIPSSAEELKIFLIAYTRNTVDALLKTLNQSGIKPELMDLAPLAITNVVGRKTAVVADVRSSGMDIVVTADGVPEVIRSIPLPQEKSSKEKLHIIRDELQRTINFYTSGKPGKGEEIDLPVYLSGVFPDEPEVYCSLSEQLGYTIQQPLPNLQYPPEMSPAHYMINIGLVLKRLSLKGYSGLLAVNINAVPDIYQPRPLPFNKILFASGAIIVAGVIMAAVILVFNMRDQTASLNIELADANQTLTQRMADQKSLNIAISGLEKNVAAATQTYETFDGIQNNFISQHDVLNGDLTLAAGNLGSGMILTSILHSGDSLILKGTAPDEAEVRDYAGALESSGRYAEVIISSIEESQISKIVDNGGGYLRQTENVFDFTLILNTKG